MTYNDLLNELNNSISKIILSKEEEKSEYIPQFINLYGQPNIDPVTAADPFYLNKMNETISQLKTIRDNYYSNREFYFAIAKLFAQTYIPLMINEYKITDDNLIEKLINIANGNSIKIFDRGEAQTYVESFGERINGDIGAFKYHDMICFTPDSESIHPEITSEESVMNATKMLGSMIHETIHIIIDVTKKEYFNYDDKSKLTSGGTILNEGLVEMHALDFSKKYNLIHIPALYYFNNVKMCRLLKEIIGEEGFERISFNGAYEEILPTELLEKYKIAERIRYFSRKGYNVNPSKIDISEDSKKIL